MCSLESKIKYSAGPQQQRNKPSLRTILIQHGQRQLKAAFPWNTCVQPPKQQSSVCLRAANPLLALMDRPGSVRDFVIDGMLTEPLNTVRLSWGRRFWNAHTHTTCSLLRCWPDLAILCCKAPKHVKPPTLPGLSIWAASQQKLQNNILQFSAETGSTRNAAVKCWITWTYAGNWKNTWNNSRISLKGWFASLMKLLQIYSSYAV